MSEILQKDLLEYAYDKQKHEKVSMFRLGDVLEDFSEYSKDEVVKNLENLVEDGLMYGDGEFTEDCKCGICGYNYSAYLKISKKGVDVIETPKKGIFGRFLEVLSNLGHN